MSAIFGLFEHMQLSKNCRPKLHHPIKMLTIGTLRLVVEWICSNFKRGQYGMELCAENSGSFGEALDWVSKGCFSIDSVLCF